MDDDLVCSSEYNKYFSIKPKVELYLIFQDDFEAEYTYKKIKARKGYKEQEWRIKAKLITPITKTKKRRKSKND
jgi:hypothetical protein